MLVKKDIVLIMKAKPLCSDSSDEQNEDEKKRTRHEEGMDETQQKIIQQKMSIKNLKIA